jgi:LysM repeat protein
MKKAFFLISIFLICLNVKAQESKEIDYIRLHARLAVEEMHLYKIPASITLSQGILETGGGQSRLAEKANNHFGIKCKSPKEWSGPTISHTDDAPNECFRVYGSVQESYRDHSKFLAERPYYKDLFKLNMHDYKAWAHGLKKSGYATNPKYASILISRIEKYNLDKFDRITPEEVDKTLENLYGKSNIIALSGMADATKEVIKATVPEPIATIATTAMEQPIRKIEIEQRVENAMLRIKRHKVGIDYVVAYEKETLESIAKLYDFKVKDLAKYNELPTNGKLTPGQLVFFGKKKNKGSDDKYKVQIGDTMYLIAQKMGIKVDKLYHFNKMKAGEQPKVGTVLNVRSRIR